MSRDQIPETGEEEIMRLISWGGVAWMGFRQRAG